MSIVPRRRGRPAGRDFPYNVNVRLTPELVCSLDVWREAQPDKPSRSIAIRRLIHTGVSREDAVEDRTVQQSVTERVATVAEDVEGRVRRPTGRHMAAARVLLGLRQSEIARTAGISVPTLKRMEASKGPAGGRKTKLLAVLSALEAAGALFVQEPSGRLGVQIEPVGMDAETASRDPAVPISQPQHISDGV